MRANIFISILFFIISFKTFPQKVVFVGDSMTKGGPWETNELCLKSYKNLGTGGIGTIGVFNNKLSEIVSENPDIVVIALGVNDLNWSHRKQQRDKDIDSYLNMRLLNSRSENSLRIGKQSFSKRYRRIISYLKSNIRGVKIIITSVLPINERKYNAAMAPTLARQSGWNRSFLITNQQIRKMNRTLMNIAYRHNVSFVDLYNPFLNYVIKFRETLKKDPYDNSGIHFRNHNVTSESLPFEHKSHYVLWADLLRPHIDQSPYIYDINRKKKTGCK